MSRRVNNHPNAVVESFFQLLEREGIKDWHGPNGNSTSVEFERQARFSGSSVFTKAWAIQSLQLSIIPIRENNHGFYGCRSILHLGHEPTHAKFVRGKGIIRYFQFLISALQEQQHL